MIAIRDLSVTYRTAARSVPAVRGVSLEVPRGKVTAVVGESGGGKSSLVYGILRLLPPGTELSGSIDFDGMELTRASEERMREFRWKKAARVTQGAMNSLTPVLTVGYQVAEVLRVRLGMAGDEARERAVELLAMTNLPAGYARKYPTNSPAGEAAGGHIHGRRLLPGPPDRRRADERPGRDHPGRGHRHPRQDGQGEGDGPRFS